ncbi:MAG: precorrin-2 dehydrogenase/sirohydrochlorin ferrochelatase family protein [Chitinophagales bacterium]
MNTQTQQNPLYPIFLKLHQLEMLIVGAGEVGHEKLSFILKSSPDAKITVVAPWISPKVEDLLKEKVGHKVRILKRPFEAADVEGKDLVIAATDIHSLNKEVQRLSKKQGVLVNVADTPDLCDFYLGSIVTRGDLKVAISTNGKSPTFAKRFRQFLESLLPQNTGRLLQNLHLFRNELKGDFEYKVNALNELTESLLEKSKN